MKRQAKPRTCNKLVIRQTTCEETGSALFCVCMEDGSSIPMSGGIVSYNYSTEAMAEKWIGSIAIARGLDW